VQQLQQRTDMASQLAVITLGKYRKLLRLINRLPKEAKERAKEEARSEMFKHKLANESEAVLLREYMDDKIRYLRIITPKRPGDDEYLGGSTYYVVRDGKVVEGTATREKR
jgi:hypothetical protein